MQIKLKSIFLIANLSGALYHNQAITTIDFGLSLIIGLAIPESSLWRLCFE